jgi:hypothetical protein
MAMKKGYLLIIAAMMLLAPIAAYSCPPTTDTMEGHGPMHGSMTDTPSDKVAGQPMSEMKDMKSDKTVNKPMTDTQQGKMMPSK